ncbi:MAG: hypothetical protein HY880_04135 [Deltaproteobacteria bacterium]|nr:hypothetical protein [Deltaproteobacteria bacterium]
MSWTTINASQTDADSPVNQTLMDSIRTNLDDLNSRITTLNTNQLAKGWVNFNGTGTVAIRDSYNVSSITDNGTGDYTINWSTNFANADYAVSIDAMYSGATVVSAAKIYSQTVSAIRFGVQDLSYMYDVANIYAIAFGDQ